MIAFGSSYKALRHSHTHTHTYSYAHSWKPIPEHIHPRAYLPFQLCVYMCSNNQFLFLLLWILGCAIEHTISVPSMRFDSLSCQINIRYINYLIKFICVLLLFGWHQLRYRKQIYRHNGLHSNNFVATCKHIHTYIYSIITCLLSLNSK